MPNKPHYLYFMEAGNYIKIGISNDLDKRLAHIQTGCPYQVTLAASFDCRSREKARDYEFKLHKIFDDYHVIGEWFITCDKIDRFIYESEDLGFMRFEMWEKAYQLKTQEDFSLASDTYWADHCSQPITPA